VALCGEITKLIVPPSVVPAPPALIANPTFTVPVKFVSTLSNWSSAATVKPKGADTEVGGWVVTTSLVAAAAATLNARVVTDVGALAPLLDAFSVYPPAALLSVSPENVATPLTAETVRLPPPNVVEPPLGILASETVTLPLNSVSTMPEPYSALTVKPNPCPA